MIITLSGWRGWTDRPFLADILAQTIEQYLAASPWFRVGDAAGADTILTETLTALGGGHTVYRADWETFGKKAGPIRNRRMLLGSHVDDPLYDVAADLLIAFPQPGWSGPIRNSGTWNCIQQAHYRGIEVDIPAYYAETTDPWAALEVADAIA